MTIVKEKLVDLVKYLAPQADNETIYKIIDKMEKYNQHCIGLIIKDELLRK